MGKVLLDVILREPDIRDAHGRMWGGHRVVLSEREGFPGEYRLTVYSRSHVGNNPDGMCWSGIAGSFTLQELLQIADLIRDAVVLESIAPSKGS